MFPEAACCVKAAAPLFSSPGMMKASRLLTHGGSGAPQARRHFGLSGGLGAKSQPRRRPSERPDIPGLEMVTYAEKMHYMPRLTRPVFPRWERDYRDPRFYRAPPRHEMPLYKDKPCHVFNQRTNALNGVGQALWLSKTQKISGLPPQVLSLTENPANQIPDQDERVQNAIKHARFWDTTEDRPAKHKYRKTLLFNLLHLCSSLQPSHPAIGRRILAEEYSLGATWTRGEDLLQVRGENGFLHSSMDPLPVVSGREEVASTADHQLETFYPVSPTIDLQQTHVYKEDVNYTGFRDDYPYPHVHTLYLMEGGGLRRQPEQFRARMLMFTFGNALARARKLYGTQPQSVLDRPITVQSVGSNGRIFQFMVFQLNTTDLSGDDGVKNQVWMEEDVELYDFAKVRPYIKKKVVKVPTGLTGYKPETFTKFLAMYLHGAA
ncbi:39S ribosomal protein L37, mitochondrial [Centropristis striata]|uniref:39S ribosomal protein L37, mitochondrial n=1 Tax=Centropristis striata TaxID=184440 RepID=UPI0027E0BF38|nr:39S ribosomal protein L37, mitochondrial [Centropristis striata]